ncbi:hypothetical protein AN958_04738 [Leucoagaricus sp. SymC.cos]|nr:hypothetical protein AN958_04738 [Leucoagaricus sp. SymC.cos]
MSIRRIPVPPPPPPCHPETRKELRIWISKWRRGEDRTSSVFWLLGSPGTGKSAIASTVAAEAKQDGQPCAAYFFGRSNTPDNPLNVIPSLTLQFRKQIQVYEDFIQDRLSSDPQIFQKTIQTQFKELIFDPFRDTLVRKSLPHPIIIILDGIDQCPELKSNEPEGKDTQRDFIKLLNYHDGSLSEVHTAPLLWIVSSRPEWHIKQMLRPGGIGDKFFQHHVTDDEENLLQDVRTLVQDGLGKIKQKYEDSVPKDWPSEGYIDNVAEASSPLFSVAMSALQFIGDGERHDPVVGLETYLDFVHMASDKTIVAAPLSSFEATDELYRGMLRDVPSEHLSNLMAVLCLRTLYTGKGLSACLEANILGLEHSLFYAALDRMHSIIRVPPLDVADEQEITFYHPSFLDFLKDPKRPRRFASNFKRSYSTVACSTLHWYNVLLSADETGVFIFFTARTLYPKNLLP